MPEEITAPAAPQPAVPQSWDTITTEPAPAVEAPVPAVVETTPAAETLETEATPLPADEPVREGQSEPEKEPEAKVEVKDEDLREDDTPEIKALPSGSSSRKWAREQFQMAKPIHTFLDLDKDIEAFGDDLYARSPSRYGEHVTDIIKRHYEDASKMLFGIPYKDAKAKLTTNGATPAPTTTVALPTTEELATLTDEQVLQRMADVQSQAKAQAEADLNSKLEALQKQLDAVTQETTSTKEQNRQAQVEKIESDLKASCLKVVDEEIRDSGLEVKSDDPPKIANLKRAAARMIRTEYDAEFSADEENLKVIDRVREFAKRLERQNAFAQEDNLKVRLRAAIGKIKATEEFKAIFDDIETHANQSKATTRTGGPVVPAPGAPAGITPKSPMNWDEAIAQAQTAS